jgi:hypothetical protein
MTAGAAPPPGHKPPVCTNPCSEPDCTEPARSFWIPWCRRHRPHVQMEMVEITGHVDEGSRE